MRVRVRADYERDIEFLDAGAGACCGCVLQVRAEYEQAFYLEEFLDNSLFC